MSFCPRRSSLASLFALSVLCHSAIAQCDPQWQPGDAIVDPEGTVYATLSWDPDGAGPAPALLVAGGDITVGHLVSAGVAAFDGTQWSPLGSPPPGQVTALGNYNGLLIAAFSQALTGGGYSLASYDGTNWQSLGSVTSTSSFGIAIRAFTVFQGELIAAGLFSSVGGIVANNIARWNGVTWSPLSLGTTGQVNALALYSNVLYAGGSFNGAGGFPVGNLATWNGVSWAGTQSVNAPIYAMAVRLGQTLPSSYLFVAGDFTAVGAVAANKVARFSASANAWTALAAGVNGTSCRGLCVAVSGVSSYEVVTVTYPQDDAWRWNGTAWTYMGSFGFSQLPTSLSLIGGQYTVGSYLTTPAVQRFDGIYWRSIAGPGFEGEVHAVLDGGNDTIIGGVFAIDGVSMHGVARGTSNAWLPIGNGMGGDFLVNALAQRPNGDLIAGGSFTTAFGGVGENIARWNGSTWLPLGGGLGGVVNAVLAMPNGDVIAGGDFTAAGGVTATYIARWNGSTWAPLGGGLNAPVHALALLPNGEVVAGGDFTIAGSVVGIANHVARWTGSSWLPLGTALGNGLDNTVRALAVLPNGDLMAAGGFQYSGAQPAAYIARWNGTAWADTGVSSFVWAVPTALAVLPDGDLVANTGAVMRLHGSSWSTLSELASIEAMAMTRRGELVVGGAFSTIGALSSNGVATANVARLSTPCLATAVVNGTGCTSSAGPLVLTATGLPWAGSTFRAQTTGVPANAIALAVTGFSTLTLPLASVLAQGQPGCNLLVAPDFLDIVLPSAGVAQTQVVLPPSLSLAGLQFHHQVVPVAFGGAGQIVAITASNALHLTIGWF